MLDLYTSTGHKFFANQEAMTKLQNGRGQPIVTHVMLTDVCNHSCAFCSVQARVGDSLPFNDVMSYLDILQGYGLKAVILSGGGNPILYKNSGKNFNDVVDAIHSRGLEIGLITNGMPLINYEGKEWNQEWYIRNLCPLTSEGGRSCGECASDTSHLPSCSKYIPYPKVEGMYRKSWKSVKPGTLDKCTWIRISMSGLDHEEQEVYVPDIDPSKTTLGFSYVGHDIYVEPADLHHGKVSTRADLLSGDRAPDLPFESRIAKLTEQISSYVRQYNPKYVRLLPNCLEPSLIPRRCEQLEAMAQAINPNVVFVQQKPPKAPHACYLGYIHPVLNCDGYVYPCDSCVLNEAANHQFANPWRICHWTDIASIYEQPVRSLIVDPKVTCPGCVFTQSNEILRGVVECGEIPVMTITPEHVNFV